MTTITATHTTVTDNTAVNVFDRLWLVADEDGIHLHEIDPDNVYDDIPLGPDIDDQGYGLDEAIDRVGDLVVLDDDARNRIRGAFTA